jgi:hypothetical protein
MTAKPVVVVIAVLACLQAVTAQAQRASSGDHLSITTPARLPGQPSPADRVEGAEPGGQDHAAGPANGTPFSASPVGTQPSDDLEGPHSRQHPAAGAVDTPNLSR